MKKPVKRKAVRKLRAIQTSRHLRLVPATHSGRLIHKRNTSYPTLAMILLCVGVFMFGWTRAVMAGPISYDVQGRVAGDPPSQAATIESPSNGFNATKKPINVQGTCPISTYVQLFRNDVASGIALCDASGRYSVMTDLYEGPNTLVVKVYNLADTPGPDSSPVTVTYSSAAPTIQEEEKPITTASSPLVLKSSYTYKGVHVDDKVSFPIHVSGGQPPYAVAVDWGDGQRSLYSLKKEGEFTIEHRYERPGGFKGNYKVIVSASDSEDKETMLQLIAIVNAPPSASGSTNSGGGPLSGVSDTFSGFPFSYFSELTGVAWQTYGITVLMLGSFWLGELRELGRLKPRIHRRR